MFCPVSTTTRASFHHTALSRLDLHHVLLATLSLEPCHMPLLAGLLHLLALSHLDPPPKGLDGQINLYCNYFCPLPRPSALLLQLSDLLYGFLFYASVIRQSPIAHSATCLLAAGHLGSGARSDDIIQNWRHLHLEFKITGAKKNSIQNMSVLRRPPPEASAIAIFSCVSVSSATQRY